MRYHLEEPAPQLTAPVLIAALDGWVDAAAAASGAAQHLGDEGPVVARFLPDALFDYRSRRPVLDVVDGVLTDLTWPALTVRHVRPADGRDVLVLSGAEPDLNWQGLAQDMVALCRTFGVEQWISLGAVPAAVPHTQPVPVMATASAPGLLHNGETAGPAGRLRVPAACLSVLEMAVTASGIPAVGFFAQVPPYAGSGYTAGTVRLLEHLERHLRVVVPLEALRETARQEHRRFDIMAENDPETREILDRLEQIGAHSEDLPTGDELASELERFLREHNEGEGSGPGFGSG
ncbi:MAG: PAC2 family protein [Thermoleophilia bacterium]